VLGSQFKHFTQEILERDLAEVPTWRLFEMQQKAIAEIKKDFAEVEFTQVVNIFSDDTMNESLTKIVKWIG
jgi:hypothetical protein